LSYRARTPQSCQLARRFRCPTLGAYSSRDRTSALARHSRPGRDSRRGGRAGACPECKFRHLSRGVAPGSKGCRLGQGVLRSTLQLLAGVEGLAFQTLIDEPLAGRLLSAESGWRITSYASRAGTTGIRNDARKGRI